MVRNVGRLAGVLAGWGSDRVSEEFIEELERLLRSPMQRFTSVLHRFCMEHGLPRLHSCMWDRHCRRVGAPRRISVMWGRHHVWVDIFEDVGWWPPLSFRRHSRPKKSD